MATNIAKIGFEADTKQLEKAEKALDDLVPAAKRADDAADKLEKTTNRLRDTNGRFVSSARSVAEGLDRTDTATKRLGSSFQRLRGYLTSVQGLYATVASAAIVGAVVKLSDQYTSMVNILKVVEGAQGNVNDTLSKLEGISSRTRAPLQATVELYQRISIASREMGKSQSDVLRFTENIGLALAQQGGSAEQASGALMQLSQAMGGGIVRAEEFNSIMEGAYPIMLAAAKGVEGANGSIGKLRQMMLDGKLTSKVFFDAIISQTDDLTAAFANTTPTIGAAFGMLWDKLSLFVGRMNDMTGASGGAATAIILLANNIQLIASFVMAAAIAVAAYYTPAMVAASASTMVWVASLITLRTALAATGIGVLVIVLGLVINELIKGVQALGSFGAAFNYIWRLALEVGDRIMQGFTAMGQAIAGVATGLQLVFVAAFAFIARKLGELLQTVRTQINSVFTSVGLEPLADVDMSGVDALDAKVKSLSVSMQASFESSKALEQDALRPLETQMGATADAAGGTDSSMQKLLDSLNGLGGEKGGAKKALTELQKLQETLDKLNEPFNQATSAVQAVQNALDNGIIKNDMYVQSLDRIKEAFLRAGGNADQWQKIMNKNTNSVGAQLDSLAKDSVAKTGDAFAELATGGSANFSDLARSIIKDLISIAIQAMIVKPLLSWMGFADGTTVGTGSTSGSVTAAAKGMAFGFSGAAQRFANGSDFTNSIVSQATPFGFSGAGGMKQGVMGEAGPEAIMPLKRGPDGSLGVQMHGAGASSNSGAAQRVHVTVGVEEGDMFRPYVSEIARNEASDVSGSHIRSFNDALPDRMEEINSDNRLR